MKTVVVSAINVFTGGPLTIVREFVQALLETRACVERQLRVILFCHSSKLYADLIRPQLSMIPKPASRRTWAFRLFYEYLWFKAWSRDRDIDTWVSLHDITPSVNARHRIVYCHNPAPFYRGPSTWRYDPGFELFRLLYRCLYQINLTANEHIIVQQQWLRDAFISQFACQPSRIVVARPVASTSFERPAAAEAPPMRECTFLFPAFPRVFKNFEVLIEAMSQLTDIPARLILTFSGLENTYARAMAKRCRDLPNVTLEGFLSQGTLRAQYSTADALVFPSKLETWGLPLSEFRAYGKPIFASDLPYARETLSGYEQACFFDPDDSNTLSQLLREFCVLGWFTPKPFNMTCQPPYAKDWRELIRVLELEH